VPGKPATGSSIQSSLGGGFFYTPVTGAVPEPATWAMMLLGFGGIGAAMRRRRKEILPQLA